ncbi:MAG: sugar phosphate isomerase/epimerase [Fimbriimonadaceae bacterium]|nr:sugar phosphate isomerase/epimerase [Fimbriimonadaceae bacterium]
MERRTFMASLGGLALAAGRGRAAAEPPLFPARLGVCAGCGQGAALQAAGAAYVEDGVQRLLVPDKPDEVFAPLLAAAQACPLPVAACNGFLPGSLRVTGPEARPDDILKYAAVAFARAAQVGVQVIVFGSGGARKLPEGFAKEAADQQFVALLKQMGPLAAPHGVTVVIEPLRRQECNYVNTVREGAAIATAVAHPNIRLLADLYHMLQNGETADDLATVAPLLAHTHVAEKANRTAPGVAGDDLGPFLKALRTAGYRGRMSIEGKWSLDQLPRAFEVLRTQGA